MPASPPLHIGFIGLGVMGAPMAGHLAAAGHRLTLLDADAPVATALAVRLGAGAQVAATPADVAAHSDIVITMLPHGGVVQQVALGEAGLVQGLRPGALLLDCSSAEPWLTQATAAALAAQGAAMVDAPVSGGVGGATAGTLTFMVGGSEASFAKAKPILEKMGKNIFHAGANGAGQTVKVCNNMLLGIQMLGTSEALRLGIANGLDPKVLSDIMTKSSGRNWALELYNPCPGVMENVPSSKGYAGGFGVDLMLKDLGLAVENAENLDASVPLGKLAQQLYEAHRNAGYGQLDFSSVFNLKK